MKGKTVVVDRLATIKLAALFVDGTLHDLFIERESEALLVPGTIVAARVERQLTATGGCFAKLPARETGYVRKASGLRVGDIVILQVSAYPEPGKAIPMTSSLRLRGSYAVFTPGNRGISVSRKIVGEDERRHLLNCASEVLQVWPEQCGAIIRTAALKRESQLRAELEEFLCLSQSLLLAARKKEPAIVMPGPDPRQLAVSEWISNGNCEVADYEGAALDYQLPDRLDEAGSTEFPIPGGGCLYIEETRALVAVDVNTGRRVTGNAAVSTSLNAASMLPRLLRVKGIGGQVLIDFPSLRKNLKRVIERKVVAAFAEDYVPTTVVGWTKMGLFELHRKRDRLPLGVALNAQSMPDL